MSEPNSAVAMALPVDVQHQPTDAADTRSKSTLRVSYGQREGGLIGERFPLNRLLKRKLGEFAIVHACGSIEIETWRDLTYAERARILDAAARQLTTP